MASGGPGEEVRGEHAVAAAGRGGDVRQAKRVDAGPGPKPVLPMSEEREIAVIATVVLVMVLGAIALASIDAGNLPRWALTPTLAVMALLLLFGPAAGHRWLLARRDEARRSGRDFPIENYKRGVVWFLVVAGVGMLIYIVFFASGV